MSELAHTPPGSGPEINAWFFRETGLDDLLRGVRPLESIDDLALDNLTADEARSFLDSIRE